VSVDAASQCTQSTLVACSALTVGLMSKEHFTPRYMASEKQIKKLDISETDELSDIAEFFEEFDEGTEVGEYIQALGFMLRYTYMIDTPALVEALEKEAREQAKMMRQNYREIIREQAKMMRQNYREIIEPVTIETIRTELVYDESWEDNESEENELDQRGSDSDSAGTEDSTAH